MSSSYDEIKESLASFHKVMGSTALGSGGIRSAGRDDSDILWLTIRWVHSQLNAITSILKWVTEDRSWDDGKTIEMITENPKQVYDKCMNFLQTRTISNQSKDLTIDIQNSLQFMLDNNEEFIKKHYLDDKNLKKYHDTDKPSAEYDDAFFEACANAIYIPMLMSFSIGTWPLKSSSFANNMMVNIRKLGGLHMRLKKIEEDDNYCSSIYKVKQRVHNMLGDNPSVDQLDIYGFKDKDYEAFLEKLTEEGKKIEAYTQH